MKNEISKIKIECTIGFMYWINETHNLRGLKNVSIIDYESKLQELKNEYFTKYPNGLIGWN